MAASHHDIAAIRTELALLRQRSEEQDRRIQSALSVIERHAALMRELEQSVVSMRADFVDVRKTMFSQTLALNDHLKTLTERVETLTQTLDAIERRMERAAIVAALVLSVLTLIAPQLAPFVGGLLP